MLPGLLVVGVHRYLRFQVSQSQGHQTKTRETVSWSSMFIDDSYLRVDCHFTRTVTKLREGNNPTIERWTLRLVEEVRGHTKLQSHDSMWRRINFILTSCWHHVIVNNLRVARRVHKLKWLYIIENVNQSSSCWTASSSFLSIPQLFEWQCIRVYDTPSSPSTDNPGRSRYLSMSTTIRIGTSTHFSTVIDD